MDKADLSGFLIWYWEIERVYFLNILFNILFKYLFILRESMCEEGRGRERRGNPICISAELNVGLDPTNHEIMNLR